MDLWILSLGGSLASRSQLQERKKPMTTSEMGGLTLLALLEKSDRNTSGQKMSRDYLAQWIKPQKSLWDISEPYSETWPKWGMMQNGVVFRLKKLGLLTKEKDYGYGQSWATPNTMDTLPPKSKDALYREATEQRPWASRPTNLRDQVAESEREEKYWPSPAAKEPGWKNLVPVDKDGNYPESINQRWYDKDTGRLLQKGLLQAITYQTPITPSQGLIAENCFVRRSKEMAEMKEKLGAHENRYLNPEWVEWLMGWPIGWTSLAPLPAESIKKWLQGDCWEVDPADTGEMTRVLPERSKDLRGRLTALGNGQVPQSAYLAHKILAKP